MKLTKQQIINKQLEPFLQLSGEVKWQDIYNAINQFILITNELEKQGNIIFKDTVGQLEKVEHKE
jgi:hypothetical protein